MQRWLKKNDETGDQVWESGGELTQLKNREVQRYIIVKYCESEDKLEQETMEKFFPSVQSLYYRHDLTGSLTTSTAQSCASSGLQRLTTREAAVVLLL